MYVYHLPYAERMQLCKVLDQNNRWEELAGIYMQYNVDEINVSSYKSLYYLC